MQPDDSRHGTTAGYNAHRYQGETACAACKSAAAAYFARREMALADGRVFTVPARGSLRRIHALVAVGWSMEHQAAHLGVKKQAVQNFAVKSPDTMIRVASAKRYSDLYDELHMIAGPSERARQVARRKGWAPPLAWDDIDNDDAPDIDAIADRSHRAAIRRAQRVIDRPPCGTEQGYQWHYDHFRKRGKGKWPLPADDPCGCRAAHSAHETARYHARKESAA